MYSRTISRLIPIAIVVVSLTLIAGCKKDDDVTGTTTDTVPADIFPLTAGHSFVYTGFLTLVDANGVDTETELSIGGNPTSAGYRTSWTVGPVDPTTGMTVLIDSTTVPAAGIGTIFPIKVTNLLAGLNATSGEYTFMTNLGFFFRSFAINSADSLKVIILAKTGLTIGESFTSFEQSYAGTVGGAPTTLTLKITGTWQSHTTETFGGVAYDTYYLVINREISVAGNVVAGGPTAKLWVSPGVGPVKMFLAGDAETPGNYRTISSKNF